MTYRTSALLLGIAVASALNLPGTAPAETLAYWSFDEATAGDVPASPNIGGSVPDTVHDASGNGNHLQTWIWYTAPTYVTDLFPSGDVFPTVAATRAINRASLDFNGTTDDLYTNAKPLNTRTFDEWTVETSFKLDSTGKWQVLVSKDGNPVGGQSPLSVKVRSNNRLEIGMVDGSGVARSVVGPQPIVANKWYHAAATATSNTLSLWVKPADSTVYLHQGSAAINGAFFNTSPQLNRPWTVGRGMWNGAQVDRTDGRIDEIRISDTALLPAQFLGSFGSEDSDHDGLPDGWEVAWFREAADEQESAVLAKFTGTDDPDGDEYDNSFEFRYGSNPVSVESFTGLLAREVWLGIPGEPVTDLTSNPRFYGAPDIRGLNAGVEPPVNFGETYGQRLSGWITAPATGGYTFWISGNNGAELWLSSSESRFQRKRVAHYTGWTYAQEWEKFPTQKSATVDLVAGQRYYFEVLHKDDTATDYCSAAWKVPGGQRAVIPADALQPYPGEPGDRDEDGLPDAWEIQHGLDPDDNGTLDPDRGPLGDPDGDGFTNAEEFASGTSPILPGGLPGYLSREVWLGIPGDDVETLTSSPRFTGVPDVSGLNPGIEPPTNFAEQYGQRMRGWITAPVSGGYTFWIAGTNNACLFLSSDSTKSNKRRIAHYSGYTFERQWDVFATQRSQLVELVAGQRYYIEILHKEGEGYDYFSAAWQVPGGQRQVIPAGVLESYTAAAAGEEDRDDDFLPDAWELQHGLDPDDNGSLDAANGEYGDPDGDDLPNFEEFRLGLDPWVAQPTPGKLLADHWYDLSGYSVQDLIKSERIYEAADMVALKTPSELKFPGQYFGTRTRGYIMPEVTGDYTFWISARTSAELWLSSDDVQGKYAKRLIAAMDSQLGSGHGIAWNEANLWDRFSRQRSEPIRLEAGRRYYVEILHQNGHTEVSHSSVAWAVGDGPRMELPESAVSSYVRTADDADDDYLPDAWEGQHGLSVEDNGGVDSEKQGERGDFDRDGLTNREEYLLGTNPLAADTDGDGVSDYDEVRGFGTSPTVSNTLTGTEVDAPPLTGYNPQGTSGTWQILDGGLLGSSFRGKIEWNFTVPADGWWIIDVGTRLRGNLRPSEEVPVGIAIDGLNLAGQTMRFINGQPSNLKVVTPFLTAGTHAFSLDIRNDIGRRTLQIQSLKVVGPGGFDADNNGRPDWLDAYLAKGNVLAPVAAQSPVSPAFIEGSVRYLGAATVETLEPSTSSSNPSGSPEAQGASSVAVKRGLGDQHWFSDVYLEQNRPTTIRVGLEHDEQIVQVEWTRWNAAAGQDLIVRVGDSVKIGGWIGADSHGSVQITVDGETRNVADPRFFVKSFTIPGSYPVTVADKGVVIGSSVIHVIEADLGEPGVFYFDTLTWRSFAGVPASLRITTEPSLAVEASEPEGTGQKVLFRPFEAGEHALAARIGNAGPIVALGAVTTIGVADALRGDAAEYVGSLPDGYRVLRSPVVVTDLPAGGYVLITIHRAGVTFLDGTSVMTLEAGDFVDGVAYLEFRYPPGMTGGYCHYIDVYDADGNHLGRR